ncbi:response regulator [Enterococcus sp.]|uniref:response regulator n=1 Tax=Enterococcus sp. TaxID=35783 RepID=UPI00291446FB|nr:response regulator [Enterococcus sp.]MDU5334022.1 response regulator [Enterococcus sp.]
MYKIFIAEDEHLIRESLKRNINQLAEKLPIEVVGEASDGEVALSMILELQPDILVTDIRMPFMDGIELSQEVKQNIPNIQIIFISGFDEFTYAKAAIHLQVAEYLLKPIKFNELQESLEKVVSRMEQSKQPTVDDSYSFDVKKNLFLNALFGNQSTLSEALEGARQLKRQIAGKKFIVLLITNPINKNFADYERFREKMTRLFDEDDSLLFSCLSSRFIKILLFHPDEDVLLQKADQVALTLYTKLNSDDSNLVVAIGNPVERISEIQKSYETAKSLLDYSLVQTKQPILHYQDFDQKLNQYQKELHLKEQIDEMTNQNRHLLIAEFIEMSDKSENPLLFRLIMVNELNQLAAEKNAQMKDKFPIPSPTKISTILSDPVLFRQYLEQILDFLKKTVIDERMRQYRELLDQAIVYIKQNFSDTELSLGSVADHINLSSSHFSTIFSQALGKTFVEYLTEQRLKEAKRLLANTDWKLSVIATEIGYNDPNYFSYIFKRKEGLSPKEYRKKNRQ